jgi:tRNA threonylcarbamoyladenosine biosynthesis protein TsaB
MIEAVLAELGWARSSLDAVACCRGPGSFTGVRISTGVAQGLALGLGVPVVPVSTLATLAASAIDAGEGHVLAALDARKGEVYWAAFEPGPSPLTAERVTPPSAVVAPIVEGAGWCGVGTGFSAYSEALRAAVPAIARIHDRELPDARYCWSIARGVLASGTPAEPGEAVPVYLRDNVADKPRQ